MVSKAMERAAGSAMAIIKGANVRSLLRSSRHRGRLKEREAKEITTRGEAKMVEMLGQASQEQLRKDHGTMVGDSALEEKAR